MSYGKFDVWQDGSGRTYNNVLQTKYVTDTGFQYGTTTSWQPTGLIATITPKFANSAIYLLSYMHLNADIDNDSMGATGPQTAIYRNGVMIRASSEGAVVIGGQSRTLDAGWKFLDNAASTRPLTYQIYWRCYTAPSGGRNAYYNYDARAFMCLMEIGGY